MKLLRLTPRQQDRLLLKWPVLLFVLALMGATVWCLGAARFRSESEQAMRASRTQRQSSQAMVHRLEEETRTINTYLGPFQALVRSGVIGGEDRLALMETMARLRNQHQLYPLQIDIKKQTTLPLSPSVEGLGEPGQGLSLYASRISVELSLLHEEDLFRLLAGLEEVGRGVFITEHCELQRSSEADSLPEIQLARNLSAKCSLLWLTLDRTAVTPAADENTPPAEIQ